MTRLAEFVCARLREEELAARAASVSAPGEWQALAVGANGELVPERPWDEQDWAVYCTTQIGVTEVTPLADSDPTGMDRATARHIARHGAARVIQRCTALLRVVQALDHYEQCDPEPGGGLVALTALHELAAGWADHPDYERIVSRETFPPKATFPAKEMPR